MAVIKSCLEIITHKIKNLFFLEMKLAKVYLFLKKI